MQKSIKCIVNMFDGVYVIMYDDKHVYATWISIQVTFFYLVFLSQGMLSLENIEIEVLSNIVKECFKFGKREGNVGL